MPAPDSIRTLCETFALHRDHYTSASYNETELRREFLDPFFTAAVAELYGIGDGL